MSQSVTLSRNMSHPTAFRLKAPGYGQMSFSDSSWSTAGGCPLSPAPLVHQWARRATRESPSLPIPSKGNEIIVNNLSMESLLTRFIVRNLWRAPRGQLCRESWQGRKSKKCNCSDFFPLAAWLQGASASMPLRSLIYNPNVSPLLRSKASSICNKMAFKFSQHLLPCAKWNITQLITIVTSTYRGYSFSVRRTGMHKFSINFSFEVIVIWGAKVILPYIMPTLLALFPLLSLRLCQCFH